MRVVCISDTHTRTIKNMPEGDLLIHSGDYSGRGSIPNLCAFVEWLDELDYMDIVVISGNHDFNGERESALTKQIFESAGVHYLDDSGITINDTKIWGSPVSPEFGGWSFNRNQIEIQDHWSLIPDDTNILITHCPPFGILDTLSKYNPHPGAHVGCPFLRKTIDDRLKSLKLHVFGHIHESYGIYEQDQPKITYVNASSLDEHYQLKNKPIVIDL